MSPVNIIATCRQVTTKHLFQDVPGRPQKQFLFFPGKNFELPNNFQKVVKKEKHFSVSTKTRGSKRGDQWVGSNNYTSIWAIPLVIQFFAGSPPILSYFNPKILNSHSCRYYIQITQALNDLNVTGSSISARLQAIVVQSRRYPAALLGPWCSKGVASHAAREPHSAPDRAGCDQGIERNTELWIGSFDDHPKWDTKLGQIQDHWFSVPCRKHMKT